ncbi:MAG: T9SS type A sorting domain-containing protein, partial [Ignavibacteria bacterium]|nr:T9SS type A sorting domain-containing protein [Ignavibacteria bacterium]
QNYPNPFNPSTKIKYVIPDMGIGLQPVNFKIFDVLGNDIKTLVNKEQAPGMYEVEFSAYNVLASGVYFYQLQAGDFVQTRKMILIK